MIDPTAIACTIAGTVFTYNVWQALRLHTLAREEPTAQNHANIVIKLLWLILLANVIAWFR